MPLPMAYAENAKTYHRREAEVCAAANGASSRTSAQRNDPATKARHQAADPTMGRMVHSRTMNPDGAPSARQLFGVALISATLLMTELALTRIFSVIMYYHFAFLS